jgi:hypothetical protein
MVATYGCSKQVVNGQSPVQNSSVALKNQLPIQSDGSTNVSGYQVPGLDGWERETTPKGISLQSVKYVRVLDGTKIMIEFILFPPRSGGPDTAQTLANIVEVVRKSDKKKGKDRQWLLSQATQYRGHPAYLIKTLSREGSTLIEVQILRVADGKRQFWFQQEIRGERISPAASKAASVAWQDMTQNLKIP